MTVFGNSDDMRFKIGGDTAGFDMAMARVLSTAKGAAIGLIGFGTAAGALKYVTTEAMQGEKSMTLLKLSLQNAKGGSQEMMDSMDGLSKKMSTMSGFSDNQVKAALTNMTNATGDANVAMKGLQPAIELAIAKNMDLGAAANIVARAYENGGKVLTRLVPSLKNVGSGMEAVDAIGKKFSGTMDAYGDTTEGSLKRAKASMDIVAESIGHNLLPVIADLADAIAKAAQWWDKWLGGFGEEAQISEQEKIVEGLRKEHEWREKLIAQYKEQYGKKISGQRAVELYNMEQELDQYRIKIGVEEGRLKGLQSNKPKWKQHAGAGTGEASSEDMDYMAAQISAAAEAAKKYEGVLKHLADVGGEAFMKLGEAAASGDLTEGLQKFAADGVDLFVGAIADMIKAQMALDITTGNLAGVAIGAAELAGLGAIRGGFNAMASQPTASQTQAPVGGGQGGRIEYHSHVHVDNLQDPDRIMRETLAPALGRYVAQHHGGAISKPNGTLAWRT